MEIEEISRKLVYKVFSKKEIILKESRFFRANYAITPKDDEGSSFITIECLKGAQYENDPHFTFRCRIYHPDEFTRLQETDSNPLNLKDAIKYLKLIKPLLIK